jgi:hypothetical protein
MKMRTAKYCVVSLILAVLGASASAQSTPPTPNQTGFADFQRRVADYTSLRTRTTEGLNKLPEKATPEQIEVYKKSLQTAIRAARRTARKGDLLTPATAASIRNIIRKAYVGAARAQLRTEVMEAENKTVPVRVNGPYPEASEILEMPPKLLLLLPQLPKELRWRFVANNLLLMDNDTLLIVDYMTNALP